MREPASSVVQPASRVTAHNTRYALAVSILAALIVTGVPGCSGGVADLDVSSTSTVERGIGCRPSGLCRRGRRRKR